MEGGIVNYGKFVQEQGIPSLYIGKNFTFDQRLGERLTPDVLTSCITCGNACDEYINCTQMGCQTLMIQCGKCRILRKGTCSDTCQTIVENPDMHALVKKQGCRLTHHQRVRLDGRHLIDGGDNGLMS